MAASHGNVDLVEVLRYRLVKPYRPALFDATVRELDNDISKLAKQLSGRVAGRRTVRIAGRKSRSYVIEYGPGKSQEIAFVLEGETEYELLCRRRAAESDAVCAAFFAGFSLT